MSNYPTTDRPIDREDQRKLTEDMLVKIEASGFKTDTSLPFGALEFYGIEGIGKTRILNVVKELCETRQLPFITIESSYNWRDGQDQIGLISEVLRSICEQLSRRSEVASLAASASAILENIQRGREQGGEHMPLVKEFIGILVEIQTRIHSPFILMLDKTEYCPQELFNWLGTDFLRLFLEAERSPGVALFLAGRGRRIRESSWPSYFKRVASAYPMDPFNFEYTGDHVSALTLDGYYRPATRFIYDLSNGHPYSTEMIVYELDRMGVKADAVEEHRIPLAEKLYDEVIRRHILVDTDDWVKRFVEVASVPRWFKPDILKRLFNAVDDLPEDFRSADSAWVTHKIMELRNPPLNLIRMTPNAYEVERSLRKLLQKVLSILHTQENIRLHQIIKDLYAEFDSFDPTIVREILFHAAVIAVSMQKDALKYVEDELRRQINRFDPANREGDLQKLVELRLALDSDVELLELVGQGNAANLVEIIDEYSTKPSENINFISLFSSPSEYHTTWYLSGEVGQSMWPAERIYTHQHYSWDDWRSNMKQTGVASFAAYLPREARDFIARYKDANFQLVANYSDIPWELFHDGSEYLCLRHAMARKPQIRDRYIVHPTLPENSMHALVIGNPTGDLPEAEQEAQEVASLLEKKKWQVDVLIHEKATVNAMALKLSNTSYRLIHYAGHGRFNVDVPQKSSLVLKDYPWLAEEFERQLSSSAFIYLSACKSAQTQTTNNAQSPRGEFMEGVAISTLRGGAKGCLGPLWGVRDDWAREFALTFYRHALAGETLGESVRQSRLAMRNKPDDFWAGWVLYGDPSHYL
ncbi:MAG: CHAT domain-containing protein [Chloroflexota bacterium]